MANSSTMSREIIVQYFASLREKRGLSEEIITTNANTPQELYQQLQKLYALNDAPAEALSVAINHVLDLWDKPLQTGDTVAFLSPYSRG